MLVRGGLRLEIMILRPDLFGSVLYPNELCSELCQVSLSTLLDSSHLASYHSSNLTYVKDSR